MLNKVIKMGLYSSNTNIRIKAPETSMHREKVMKGHSKKADLCKPRREASGESKPVDSLILNFSSFRIMRNKFMLFHHLVCGILLQQSQQSDERNFTQAGKNLYRKLIIYSYIKNITYLCQLVSLEFLIMHVFLCIHHWPSSYAAFLKALAPVETDLVSFTNDFLDKPNGQLSFPIIFLSRLVMPDIAKHLLC